MIRRLAGSLGAAALALVVAGPAIAADSQSVSFAREIVGLVNSGDADQVLDRSRAVDLTCPTVEGLSGNVCEGKPAGTATQGYLFGVFGGADFYSGDSYVAQIEEAAAAFGGTPLRLYTIAEGGLQTGEQCAGCFVAVASTPAEADLADGQARVFSFQVQPGGDGLKVTGVFAGVVTGDQATARINGGQLGHLNFVTVGEAGPPAAGTGLQPERGRGAGLPGGLLILVAAAALVGLVLLLRRASRRA